MDIDPEIYEYVIRSRSTILEILDNRGYNVDAYKNISPSEIEAMAMHSSEDIDFMRINASKKEGSDAPMSRAVVIYWISGNYKPRIESQINELFREKVNPETDELIIILAEPLHESFHNQAILLYKQRGIRVGFFNIKNLISNPARHIMVPKHRKLNAIEIQTLMAGLRLKSKYELPHIKYHVDMQARVLGLVPGDIVEITRPSETSGENVIYRVCSP
jgi:DNA-directed RNA polymerase subunit H (RpoH/RPB5)